MHISSSFLKHFLLLMWDNCWILCRMNIEPSDMTISIDPCVDMQMIHHRHPHLCGYFVPSSSSSFLGKMCIISNEVETFHIPHNSTGPISPSSDRILQREVGIHHHPITIPITVCITITFVITGFSMQRLGDILLWGNTILSIWIIE